jgi:hypothetical protein
MQLEFSDCKSSSSFLFLWGNNATVDPIMLSLDLVRAADMVVFCVGIADESVSGHSESKKSDPIDAVHTLLFSHSICGRVHFFPCKMHYFMHYFTRLREKFASIVLEILVWR